MTTDADRGSLHAVVRRAFLHLDGWEGRTRQAVLVIGETKTRYRIGCEQTVRLAGRCRSIKAGETTLVPKYAITFTETQAPNQEEMFKGAIAKRDEELAQLRREKDEESAMLDWLGGHSSVVAYRYTRGPAGSLKKTLDTMGQPLRSAIKSAMKEEQPPLEVARKEKE